MRTGSVARVHGEEAGNRPMNAGDAIARLAGADLAAESDRPGIAGEELADQTIAAALEVKTNSSRGTRIRS
jgi:hypothetical protein